MPDQPDGDQHRASEVGGAVVTGVAAELWGAQASVAVVAPTASVLAGLVLARGAGHLFRDLSLAAADVLRKRDERH